MYTSLDLPEFQLSGNWKLGRDKWMFDLERDAKVQSNLMGWNSVFSFNWIIVFIYLCNDFDFSCVLPTLQVWLLTSGWPRKLLEKLLRSFIFHKAFNYFVAHYLGQNISLTLVYPHTHNTPNHRKLPVNLGQSISLNFVYPHPTTDKLPGYLGG